MRDVIALGLSPGLARWLAGRLPGLSIHPVDSAEAALRALEQASVRLLVIDYAAFAAAPGGRIEQWASEQKVPIIWLMDRPALESLPGRGAEGALTGRYLLKPIDPDELAHQIAVLLDLPPYPAEAPATGGPERVVVALRALWDRFKPTNLARVEVLEAAARALARGELDPADRQRAIHEAHKLAGAVGSFGFLRGSVIAQEIEQVLRADGRCADPDTPELLALVAELRTELEGGGEPESRETTLAAYRTPGPADGRAASARAWATHQIRENRAAPEHPAVLIVTDDPEAAARLTSAARAVDLRVKAIGYSGSAREVIARERPDLVLLDLSSAETPREGWHLLAELSTWSPPVPAIVLAERDDLADRVEVARLGGRGFLVKSLAPAEVIAAIRQMLSHLQPLDGRILAVDDDPQVLATLRALLESAGFSLTTINDPRRFWDALQETAPDLVMVDVDMPGLSGIELCRVVRSDPRWSSTPVLFLTARTDAETIYRVFAAGADDYVTKPFVGPELLTRIVNRLDRVRLYRRLAETDFLTGVANPRKATQIFEQLLLLARRQGQPICLAIVDLDHFKQINDCHGHAAGDAVLRRVGELLLRRFRSADLVSRWGGEEFILAMYGMTRADGVQRIASALASLRDETFFGAGGQAFRVTFSAGVAQYPEDGEDFTSLYRAADKALYRAKGAGRNQVCAASPPGDPDLATRQPALE